MKEIQGRKRGRERDREKEGERYRAEREREREREREKALQTQKNSWNFILSSFTPFCGVKHDRCHRRATSTIH